VDCFAVTESLYNVYDPDQTPVSQAANQSKRTPTSVHSHVLHQHCVTCWTDTWYHLLTLLGDAGTYELLTGLDCMLDLAGFRPVPPEYIEVARKSTDVRGLQVQGPPPNSLSMHLFYRRILPTIVCCPPLFIALFRSPPYITDLY
jgi:hypothetical protein